MPEEIIIDCNDDCIILTMIVFFANVTSNGSRSISYLASWLKVLTVISRAIAVAYTEGGGIHVDEKWSF
eukprot:scaffold5974_cov158-Ochromonas_danica.AAC.23